MKRLLLVLAVLTGCTPVAEQIDQPSLDELVAGRPAIINFWASWCSFCKDELPLFQEVHEKYQRIAMVGINMQEDKKVVDLYWSAGGYTFPTLLDPAKEYYQEFGIFTQPTTFVLDANGKELYRKDGPLTADELNQQIEMLDAIYDDLTTMRPTPPKKSDMDSIDAAAFEISPVPAHLRSWFDSNVQHTIPLEEILSGGPPKDGIPSIDEPTFSKVAAVDYLNDSDVGLLVEVAGKKRFYPFRILNWHEIVNDEIGGRSISVTFCPLCDTAVVYDRQVAGGVTSFGVSGLLYQSNLLMYDRASESLWNQLTGEAVVGPLTGYILERIPSDIVQWATVQDSHPTATVLTTATGYSRDYSRTPYVGYDETEEVYFPVSHTDDQIHAKTRVLGIVINGVAKAYTLDGIIEMQQIEDTVGGESVVIFYNSQTGQTTITSNGRQIVPMPSFWFSWVAQYPETLLH